MNFTIRKSIPITKGLSSDKKYYIETTDNKRMFLRVSDVLDYECKSTEYKMAECMYAHGIPTPQPLGFGMYDDNTIYALFEWIDGNDTEKVLPQVSEAEQYRLGVKSSEVLNKIHSIPVSANLIEWSVRFEIKVQNWIDTYNSKSEIHCDIGEMIIRYLKEHNNVLLSRKQTYIHGDYNTENILVTANNEISIIDFNCYNTIYGDPWYELDNMAWMNTLYPHFHIGQIRGYFNGEPPIDFWNVFTYYLAYDALAALTDPYGLNGIEDGTEIVNKILKWTDNFNNAIPSWYNNI